MLPIFHSCQPSRCSYTSKKSVAFFFSEIFAVAVSLPWKIQNFMKNMAMLPVFKAAKFILQVHAMLPIFMAWKFLSVIASYVFWAGSEYIFNDFFHRNCMPAQMLLIFTVIVILIQGWHIFLHSIFYLTIDSRCWLFSILIFMFST